MNIRSINEETGSYDETLESIKDTIYGITGVSAFTDDTKQTYKSTYDYLKDISEVWDELSDKQQSTIASELFGKFQANTGLALLSNFEAAEKAMDLMADSSGNAMQEFEKATKLFGRICSNTYLRNYLIAGKTLELYTTIIEKSNYDSLKT